MRKIAYRQIEQISWNYTNPMRASRLMRDYLSFTIKVTNSTLTKNMLLNFRNNKVGFREVEEMPKGFFSSRKTWIKVEIRSMT